MSSEQNTQATETPTLMEESNSGTSRARETRGPRAETHEFSMEDSEDEEYGEIVYPYYGIYDDAMVPGMYAGMPWFHPMMTRGRGRGRHQGGRPSPWQQDMFTMFPWGQMATDSEESGGEAAKQNPAGPQPDEEASTSHDQNDKERETRGKVTIETDSSSSDDDEDICIIDHVDQGASKTPSGDEQNAADKETCRDRGCGRGGRRGWMRRMMMAFGDSDDDFHRGRHWRHRHNEHSDEEPGKEQTGNKDKDVPEDDSAKKGKRSCRRGGRWRRMMEATSDGGNWKRGCGRKGVCRAMMQDSSPMWGPSYAAMTDNYPMYGPGYFLPGVMDDGMFHQGPYMRPMLRGGMMRPRAFMRRMMGEEPPMMGPRQRMRMMMGEEPPMMGPRQRMRMMMQGQMPIMGGFGPRPFMKRMMQEEMPFKRMGEGMKGPKKHMMGMPKFGPKRFMRQMMRDDARMPARRFMKRMMADEPTMFGTEPMGRHFRQRMREQHRGGPGKMRGRREMNPESAFWKMMWQEKVRGWRQMARESGIKKPRRFFRRMAKMMEEEGEKNKAQEKKQNKTDDPKTSPEVVSLVEGVKDGMEITSS